MLAAGGGATVGRLSTLVMESTARSLRAGLFAATTGVALWSWPHRAGSGEIFAPVVVT